MAYRIAVDTGGTFTDVVVADAAGALVVGKAPTTPTRSFSGVYEGLRDAARRIAIPVDRLIADTEVLIYGTTRATNAIVTGATATTAMLCTEGFPDTLVYRSGGKRVPFQLDVEPPAPYIPRRLTFEVPERVNAEGGVERPLDEVSARGVVARLAGYDIEAVAVCLLWSISNPDHELRLGALIEELLPGVPYTLSHQLNPILREYPRASSTAIDASLKPLMQTHLRGLEEDLRAAGYAGELLVSSSSGGVMHIEDVIARPVYMVKSGPAMAPLAGLAYAEAEGLGDDVLIVDTGGTTFDVSLVRSGQVKYTRQTWLGGEFRGHDLGMSTVDVRSVGAGGGSIAWLDPGGLLRVGPQSAGSDPGPACYGSGGTEPTVTDAAVVLGYIDADHFLGGRMRLDRAAARAAIATLAGPLGMTPSEAASAVLTIASETMIKAIEEITVNDGVNPRESVLVAGGGAAGLNILPIAQALGCRRVLLPKTAGALSACGAQYSDIVSEFSASRYARTDRWPFGAVREALDAIAAEMDTFAEELRAKGIGRFDRKLFVDARYLNQQWELELKMPSERIETEADVERLVAAFHDTHERLYGVREPGASLECLNWKGRLTARLDRPSPEAVRAASASLATPERSAKAFFPDGGERETPVYTGDQLPAEALIVGPAIIEEPTTTVVVYPGMRARVSARGNYVLEPDEETTASSAEAEIDPVLLAVMSNRIDAITREMTLIVLRSARSAVIGQSRDVSCAIVTADNRLLATAEGLPAHIFGANLQTRSMCELHPELREGDAFLHNDPYMGNSHAADVSVLVPVIVDGEHLFSISVKGHQADIGNALPTTYMPHARDVYEEGALIFPAVQVQRDYRDIDDVIRMCRRRIRVPEQWHGDYLSQVGAARIGERRLKEFAAKYGVARVRRFVEEWFDYSERRAEQAIRKLPAGTLVQRGKHDPLGDFLPEGIELEVRIAIDPEAGRIVNDLRHNPDCLDSGMNLTEATATVYGFQGIFNALDNDIPPNAGSFRRVQVALRENCCVGIPRFPHSCSVATTNLGDLLVNITQAAFTQLGDGYGLSQGNMCFGGAMGVISGRDWRHDDAPYINQIYLQGGGGPASPTTDGMVYLLIPVGAGLLYRDSVEVTEQRFPMFLRALRILPDSCGAGRQRGGPGSEVILGPRVNPMTVSLLGGGKVYPPEGVLGGHASQPSYNGRIYGDGREEELPYPTMVELEPGEFVRAIDSGGSGYGAPTTRDADAVLQDAEERYVTVGHARDVYGVMLREAEQPGRYQIDRAETDRRRQPL